MVYTHQHLSFELKIIRAKNIEFKSTKSLFVRICLPGANDKTIQLNNNKVSSKSDPFWNKSFSLDCSGTYESIQSLEQKNIVFELRQSSTIPVLGNMKRSQLLGVAKISLKLILESSEMDLNEWFTMVPTKLHTLEDLKPSKLQVGLRVHQMPALAQVESKKRRNKNRQRKYYSDECGCKDGHCCNIGVGDYDIFAIGAALENF